MKRIAVLFVVGASLVLAGCSMDGSISSEGGPWGESCRGGYLSSLGLEIEDCWVQYDFGFAQVSGTAHNTMDEECTAYIEAVLYSESDGTSVAWGNALMPSLPPDRTWRFTVTIPYSRLHSWSWTDYDVIIEQAECM